MVASLAGGIIMGWARAGQEDAPAVTGSAGPFSLPSVAGLPPFRFSPGVLSQPAPLQSLLSLPGEKHMLATLHTRKTSQLMIGFCLGILFGFLLQKGGVTRYDVILGQLLLTDFTVVKVMLTAVVVGKIGVHFLKGLGVAELHPKPGSLGSSVVGGLIFGVGFALLGIVRNHDRGHRTGISGCIVRRPSRMLIGAGLFAEFYPPREADFEEGRFRSPDASSTAQPEPWWIILPVALEWPGCLLVGEVRTLSRLLNG